MFRIPLRWTGSIRYMSSVMENLINTCSSCGIALQTKNRENPGFYIEQKEKSAFHKYEDQIYLKFLGKKSDEDKALLGYDGVVEDIYKGKQIDGNNHLHEHENNNAPECLRCRDIKYRSKFTSEPIASPDITDLYNKKIIYLVNALEFPLNLNKQVLRRKPIIVITKCDLIHRSYKTLTKFPFYKEYFEKNYGISSHDIIYTSSHKNWGIQQMTSYLNDHPNEYHLLGDVNSGKSSLIARLLYYKNYTAATKFDKWIHKHGPGISNYPGFTRGPLKFDIGKSQLTDLPGLNQVHLPEFEKFKNALKVPSVHKKGLYTSKYESINGPSFLSFGGLFYMKFPKGIFQYKNVTNIQPTKLRFDKLSQLENRELDNSLVNKFLVAPTTKLTKLYIPPFYGKIDLVVKNFGYVEITPTGSKSSNDLIEVYVPSTIDLPMIVRKPLVTYTHKILSGRDGRGNPLKPENKWKSTKIIRPYTGGIFSAKLIPDLGNSYDSVQQVTGLKYTPTTVLTKDDDAKYWVNP